MTTMESKGNGLSVTRLAGHLGAEVRGLPLARVGKEDVARIEALLLEHPVLFCGLEQLW